MFIVDDDHMIEALSSDASDHALHIAVLPRTLGCDTNLLNTHSLDPRPERFAVDSVAVSNHKPRSSVFRKCFDDLLCSPNGRWMRRDIEVENSATIVCQDDEDIQYSQS